MIFIVYEFIKNSLNAITRSEDVLRTFNLYPVSSRNGCKFVYSNLEAIQKSHLSRRGMVLALQIAVSTIQNRFPPRRVGKSGEAS